MNMPTTTNFDIDTFGIAGDDDQTLGQRDSNGRLKGDGELQIRFFKKGIPNRPASIEAGRPIYIEMDFIEIKIPGQRNLVIEEIVNKEYQKRFRPEWDRYLQGAVKKKSGTPLEVWSSISAAQCEELKHYNVHTVEELAELSEGAGGNFMGYHDFAAKARAFVSATQKGEGAKHLESELVSRDARIAELESQMKAILQSVKNSDEAETQKVTKAKTK